MRACPSCHAVYTTQTDRCGLDGARLDADSVDPLRGLVFGRYRLETLLGSGALGLLYRAEDWEARSPVAIRILSGEVAVDRRSVQRFRQRVEAASRVVHPSLVEITDFGLSAKGVPFVTTKFLEGRSLRALVASEGRLPPARALALFREIAEGLQEAHRAGLAHGRLASAKIMTLLQPTRSAAIKILELGAIPDEIAPDPADDLLALGAILFEMLAGHSPFIGSRDFAGIKKRAPQLAGSGQTLIELALRLLDTEARGRLTSAEQVVLELERAFGRDPKTVISSAVDNALDTPTAENRYRGLAGSDALPTLAVPPAREMTPTQRAIPVLDAGASTRPPLIVAASARPSFDTRSSGTGMIDDEPDALATTARAPSATRTPSGSMTVTVTGEDTEPPPPPPSPSPRRVERARVDDSIVSAIVPRRWVPGFFTYLFVCLLGLGLGLFGVWFHRSKSATGRAVVVIDWREHPRAFSLLVDGKPADIASPVFDLVPGEHRIEVLPVDGTPEHRTFKVEAGRTQRVVIVMR